MDINFYVKFENLQRQTTKLYRLLCKNYGFGQHQWGSHSDFRIDEKQNQQLIEDIEKLINVIKNIKTYFSETGNELLDNFIFDYVSTFMNSNEYEDFINFNKCHNTQYYDSLIAYDLHNLNFEQNVERTRMFFFRLVVNIGRIKNLLPLETVETIFDNRNRFEILLEIPLDILTLKN